MKSDPLITYRRKPATLDAESLQSFAEVLRDRVARGREFHCRITNDAELQSLNARFRGAPCPTDVLSFPNPTLLSSTPSSPANHHVGWPIQAADSLSSQYSRPNGRPVALDYPLGDIAISIQRARTQAREYHHALEAEIRILMLHGVLHLLGMDHESDSGQMKRTEVRWRRKLGLPIGLIERSAQ
jgi:probable rRNA maturation factor